MDTSRHSISILVVDDSPQDQREVSAQLAPLDTVEIRTASNGVEALEQLERLSPTVVVTDIHMPRMDGLQLLKCIRQDFSELPVVVMTAHGSEEIAAIALNEGATGYVPKRFLERELLSLVRKILQSITARRQRQRLEQILDFTETRFILNNDLGLLSGVIGYLQDKISRLAIFDEHEVVTVGLALHEALTNAIYHGNLELSSELRAHDDERFETLALQRRKQVPFSTRSVRISGQVSSDQFQCVIRDDGMGFDVESVADPLASENLDKPSGRGLLLIRHFMDEVRHNSQGNEITMIKRSVCLSQTPT